MTWLSEPLSSDQIREMRARGIRSLKPAEKHRLMMHAPRVYEAMRGAARSPTSSTSNPHAGCVACSSFGSLGPLADEATALFHAGKAKSAIARELAAKLPAAEARRLAGAVVDLHETTAHIGASGRRSTAGAVIASGERRAMQDADVGSGPWDERTPMQKHRLLLSDPETYERLREDHARGSR